MGLIYRAIWQDEVADLHEWALAAFRKWAQDKYPVRFGDGSDVDIVEGDVEITVRRRDGDSGSVQRAVMHENKTKDRWTTTLITLAGPGGEQWVWVDLERVADDVFAGYDVAAPRLVCSLIESGVKPRRGALKLTTLPRAYRAEEAGDLAHLLCSSSRDLPVVVFSKPDEQDGTEWVEGVRRAARSLSGIALVVMVPPPTVGRFVDLMGRDLGVWGGALRLYLPGLSLDEQRPWRHRYVVADKLVLNAQRPAALVGRMLSRSVAGRRAPDLYRALRPLLRDEGGLAVDDVEAWLVEKELEIEEKEAEIVRLGAELQASEDERLQLLEELDDSRDESNALRQNMMAMSAAKGGVTEAAADLPSGALSSSQAAEQARRLLGRVAFTSVTCRDLDDLDRVPEAMSWGDKAWQGFRALHAYAEDAAGFAGGFYEWCKHTQHPYAWPATSKKLAMGESDTVMQHPKLKAARRLAVDSAVEPSGAIYMWSHLKIAEGGGMMAPRIYFHDDTKGVTGKIHIGYFGPHKHMPNTLT